MPVIYTIPEFCKAYGLSRPSFYRRAAAGSMPPVRKIGKKSVIAVADAAAWFAALPTGITSGSFGRGPQS